MHYLHGTCVKLSITEIHLSDVSVVVLLFILLLPNERYENGDTHTFHSQFDKKIIKYNEMRGFADFCFKLSTRLSRL